MRGDDLLRLKAIVALSDRPDQPVVLHGVQHLFHPPVLLPEWPSEDRRTRMVFITRDLPREAIEATLAAFEEAVLRKCRSERPRPPSQRAGSERRPGAIFSFPRVRLPRQPRLRVQRAPSWDRTTSSIW